MMEDDDVTMAAVTMEEQLRPSSLLLRSLFPDDEIIEEEQMLSLFRLISTACSPSSSLEPASTHFHLHPTSSASFVFVLTGEGRVHQSSAGVSGHLGFPQEEFVHQSVFNFVPLADQSLISRLLPGQGCPPPSPPRRERFRCGFLSRIRADTAPREVQFEISALRCRPAEESMGFESREERGCVVCVARRLPDEANKVITLSLMLGMDGMVHAVFSRNCNTHHSTFEQLVGGPLRSAVAPEYAAAAERLLTTECETPIELDLLPNDKQFRVVATSLRTPRSTLRIDCTVLWCLVRKPSPAFQPPQHLLVPPPGYESSLSALEQQQQDALSLVCSSVFGDENMNSVQGAAGGTEKVRKKPGPKKQSKPRVKKGAAAAASAAATAPTAQDSAVSSSTGGDEKNSVLKSLLGAPIQHPMEPPHHPHPAYYNPAVMYQQQQAQQQPQQQQLYLQQGQSNGYMVDMAQAQQWQQAQSAVQHPQQMYYQQQMAYQMPSAPQQQQQQQAAAPAAAPTTTAKKRKASNESGEKKPRGRQSAAAQEAARVAAAAAAAQAAAQQQQQQQQQYYQQSQMMQGEMAAYRYDSLQQAQLQQMQQQQWMMQQQPGTMNMQQSVQQQPQQMTAAQLSLLQQQQQAQAAAAAAAAQMGQRSDFVRMELRQSLQAKQMAGRPSPAGMDVAVGSVGSTGSTAGSGTFEYQSDLLSDAELESVFDFKLCSGNGCGFDLENDDYTRKVVLHLLS